MRAAALVLTLTTAACFPHNAQHRTYAKVGEGAALATGIVLLSFVGTGADCDGMRTPGLPAEDCRGNASLLSGVGLGLILAGLTGFIATVSTSPDDASATPVRTPPPVALRPAAAVTP